MHDTTQSALDQRQYVHLALWLDSYLILHVPHQYTKEMNASVCFCPHSLSASKRVYLIIPYTSFLSIGTSLTSLSSFAHAIHNSWDNTCIFNGWTAWVECARDKIARVYVTSLPAAHAGELNLRDWLHCILYLLASWHLIILNYCLLRGVENIYALWTNVDSLSLAWLGGGGWWLKSAREGVNDIKEAERQSWRSAMQGQVASI